VTVDELDVDCIPKEGWCCRAVTILGKVITASSVDGKELCGQLSEETRKGMLEKRNKHLVRSRRSIPQP